MRFDVRAPVGSGAVGTELVAAGNGAEIPIEDITGVGDLGVRVDVTGITTGTCHVESSLDGTVWLQEGANLTADGTRNVTNCAKYVRVRASVDTDIAVTYKAGGWKVAGY